MASPSAWTAKAHGVTMSLSSGFGGRSNTRRYISGPTTRCPRPGLPSADTSASTTAEDHIRALTGRRPIRPTSPRCRMSRRLNPGRSSTYQTEEAVQTSGASSPFLYISFDLAVGPHHYDLLHLALLDARRKRMARLARTDHDGRQFFGFFARLGANDSS